MMELSPNMGINIVCDRVCVGGKDAGVGVLPCFIKT